MLIQIAQQSRPLGQRGVYLVAIDMMVYSRKWKSLNLNLKHHVHTHRDNIYFSINGRMKYTEYESLSGSEKMQLLVA